MTLKKRRIGKTQLTVCELGLGGAPLGGNFADLSQSDGLAVVDAAFRSGIDFVDTAPFYGFGRSERAVGDALRGRDYTLSSKVGRLLAPGHHPNPTELGMTDPLPFHPVYDYSYDGVMRSFEDSLQRLGLGRIDILLAHDIGEMQHGIEKNAHYFNQLETGGYKAMDELRKHGHVKAIGLGVNAFNSGVLVGREMWNYAKAPKDVVDRVKKIGNICEDNQVELPVAALQFPLAHSVVSAIIPGARSPDELNGILNWATQSTPKSLWSDLASEGLIHADAPLPDGSPIIS